MTRYKQKIWSKLWGTVRGNLVELLLYGARIAKGQDVIGKVLCHHTASANGYIVPNAYTGENHGVATNPDVVPNSNRLCGG